MLVLTLDNLHITPYAFSENCMPEINLDFALVREVIITGNCHIVYKNERDDILSHRFVVNRSYGLAICNFFSQFINKIKQNLCNRNVVLSSNIIRQLDGLFRLIEEERTYASNNDNATRIDAATIVSDIIDIKDIIIERMDCINFQPENIVTQMFDSVIQEYQPASES